MWRLPQSDQAEGARVSQWPRTKCSGGGPKDLAVPCLPQPGLPMRVASPAPAWACLSGWALLLLTKPSSNQQSQREKWLSYEIVRLPGQRAVPGKVAPGAPGHQPPLSPRCGFVLALSSSGWPVAMKGPLKSPSPL